MSGQMFQKTLFDAKILNFVNLKKTKSTHFESLKGSKHAKAKNYFLKDLAFIYVTCFSSYPYQ